MTDQQQRKELRRVGLEIIDHASDDGRDIQTAIRQAVETLRLMLPPPNEPDVQHAPN